MTLAASSHGKAGWVDDFCTGRKAYVLVALLAAAMCVLSIAMQGMPIPYIHDEFTYLFAGETFAQFRLSNPSPPSPESFWSPHLMVEPSYSSKYPPAQGLSLALGIWLGHPFIGLGLGGIGASLCLLWALRATVKPLPAMAASLAFVLATLHTGAWIRSYMGGFLAFACAVLVFGFFMRLRRGRPSPIAFLLLGVGVAGLYLSRPFEGGLVCLLCGLTFADRLYLLLRSNARSTGVGLLIAALPVIVALLFQVALNRAVTGQFLRTPYAEYQSQYGTQPLFIWQGESTGSKASARMIQVEGLLLAKGGWATHVKSSIWGGYYAMISIGGQVLAWLLLISLPFLLLEQRRLLLVAIAFPLVHAVANFLMMDHYFAPIAPVWFLALGALFQVSADKLRSRLPILIGGPAIFAGLLLPQLLGHTGHPRVYHHADLVRALSAQPPSLVFVTYASGTLPDLDVVYNDPDLQNHSLFAKELDQSSNCLVLDAFSAGRQIWRVEVSDSAMSAEIVDPSEICDRVPVTN